MAICNVSRVSRRPSHVISKCVSHCLQIWQAGAALERLADLLWAGARPPQHAADILAPPATQGAPCFPGTQPPQNTPSDILNITLTSYRPFQFLFDGVQRVLCRGCIPVRCNHHRRCLRLCSVWWICLTMMCRACLLQCSFGAPLVSLAAGMALTLPQQPEPALLAALASRRLLPALAAVLLVPAAHVTALSASGALPPSLPSAAALAAPLSQPLHAGACFLGSASLCPVLHAEMSACCLETMLLCCSQSQDAVPQLQPPHCQRRQLSSS